MSSVLPLATHPHTHTHSSHVSGCVRWGARVGEKTAFDRKKGIHKRVRVCVCVEVVQLQETGQLWYRPGIIVSWKESRDDWVREHGFDQFVLLARTCRHTHRATHCRPCGLSRNFSRFAHIVDRRSFRNISYKKKRNKNTSTLHLAENG